MPVPPEYLPARRIQTELHVGPTALLWMLVHGLVKTKLEETWKYPLYCVADVKKCYDARPRKHKPDALTGKCWGRRKAAGT